MRRQLLRKDLVIRELLACVDGLPEVSGPYVVGHDISSWAYKFL